MVSESWFTNLWKSKDRSEPAKQVIGVLSFEVASLISKVVHLWRVLSDDQVTRLREEIMASIGVRKLVSDDDDYLAELASAEIIDNLMGLVKSLGRFGRKCGDPVLQRFENVFQDMIKSDADLFGWEFSSKRMDRKTKKLDKYVRNTELLYREMEALNEIEFEVRKMHGIAERTSANRIDLHRKLGWQRQVVKNLRESSLWNKAYDRVVLILARSLFTLLRRINNAFGINQGVDGDVDVNHSAAMSSEQLPRSRSVSALRQMSVHPSESNISRFSSGPLSRPSTKSGPLARLTTKSGPISLRHWETPDHSSNLHGKPPRLKKKRFAAGGPFKGCMVGGNKSPVFRSYAPVTSGYMSSESVYSGSLIGTKDAYAESLAHRNILRANLARYSSKCKLSATPSTLGAAALAPHYADVILVIEKLVESPHLISADARDDLYSMLPTSIKAALRSRLKSYVSNLALSYYDPDLAEEWREALERIMEWLAPLAHNMRRWQSERSFQQQHLVSRTSVLLVQTLFFANQAKTEAAITELLVGLNYLWRFNRELSEKAQPECTSSTEFDNYLDPNK